MKKFGSKILLSAIITIITSAIYFYVSLPAINIFDQAFWLFLIFIIAVFVIYFFLL